MFAKIHKAHWIGKIWGKMLFLCASHGTEIATLRLRAGREQLFNRTVTCVRGWFTEGNVFGPALQK